MPAIFSGWPEHGVITVLSFGDICFSLSQIHVFVPSCQSHFFIHRKTWIPVSEGFHCDFDCNVKSDSTPSHNLC